MALKIRVDSPKVKYTTDHIEAEYDYQTTRVSRNEGANYLVIINKIIKGLSTVSFCFFFFTFFTEYINFLRIIV